MVIRSKIPFEELRLNIFDQWENGWWVLTAGDFAAGKFNAMTVAWGALGVMWRRPFALVVVRPTRYTFELINTYPDFSLCAFAEEYRPALQYLGSHSGRHGDKMKKAGLTPQAASEISAPIYAEAELCLECRRMYCDDFRPEHFFNREIEQLYPHRDYHRFFYGEILALYGVEKYRRSM